MQHSSRDQGLLRRVPDLQEAAVYEGLTADGVASQEPADHYAPWIMVHSDSSTNGHVPMSATAVAHPPNEGLIYDKSALAGSTCGYGCSEAGLGFAMPAARPLQRPMYSLEVTPRLYLHILCVGRLSV